MKKFIFLLAIILPQTFCYAQTLNSVSPNVVLTGTTLTAQISGTNTLFQSSSPQGFFLEQGLTSVYASLASAMVTDEENMSIKFTIPSSTPQGSYSLQYSYLDTANSSNIISLSLANAVTITNPQLTISGNVFIDLNGNGTKDGGEQGVAGQSILITPDNQYFYTDANGDYVISTYTGNKSFSWQVGAGSYTLSAGSQPSYSGNFVTTVSGYDFGVINTGPALVSITPDSVIAGTKLSAIISATGTILQNSSPQGAILYHFIDNGLTSFFGTNTIIITDTTFSSNINVGNNAAPGFYNLTVLYSDTLGTTINLVLPNAVYVYAPEIFIEGYAYADRDSNAIRGITEPGLAGQNIMVQPDNQNFTTNNFGKFSVPTTRGNKTISITPTGSFVVNPLAQSSITGNYISTTSGIDFPLLGPGPYLTTITSDTVLAGTTLQALVSGYGTTFQSSSPPSSIIGAQIFRDNPFVSYPANFLSISPVDDENFNADFSIPANAATGLYDLAVTYESTPFTYITLYLPNAVTVVQPQLFLEGFTYLDIDNDGTKDAGEPGLANQKIILQPDNQYVFSDLNGLYQAGSYPGTHSLQWDTTGSAFTLSAGSVPSYSPTVNQTTSGFDFGLNSNLPPFECELTTLSGTRRCNQSNYHYVSYKNTGIVVYDANIIIIKSGNTTFTAGVPAPTQINGDTITYSISNLVPYQNNSLYFYINMPAANIPVSVTAIIQSLDGSGNIMDADTTVSAGNTTCSFDPNDKAVSPDGVQSSNYTLMSEKLNYLIRFQNTGNDTAFTVVIRDTIDADLNLNTFTLLDASHAVQTQIDIPSRIVTFTFNNILLVDSNANEPLSHGFVRYSIKPNNGLPNVTGIQNTAHIYFDFNDPVGTNTTLNTLVYSIPTSIPEVTSSLQAIVKVIPNPFKEEAYIVFENKRLLEYRLVIVNVQGKITEDRIVGEEKIRIKKNNLKPGLYLFKLIPIEKGSVLSGKFLIE